MTRTRLSLALGLALFAAGCPAETPPATSTAPGENLGSPEAGSTKKVGAPVTAPAPAPADTPVAPPADKPAETPAAAPAEAPKNP